MSGAEMLYDRVVAERDLWRERAQAWDAVAVARLKLNYELHVELAAMHERAVAAAAWVADLQSGMFINCVYCGHRYGPDPGTPVAMADVLKAHVEKCPPHPMSALRARLDEAERLCCDIEAGGWLNKTHAIVNRLRAFLAPSAAGEPAKEGTQDDVVDCDLCGGPRKRCPAKVEGDRCLKPVDGHRRHYANCHGWTDPAPATPMKGTR